MRLGGDFSRSRPNVVIEGGLTPFEEERWQKIQIGQIVYTVIALCKRCEVINNDQETGIPDPKFEMSNKVNRIRKLDGLEPNIVGIYLQPQLEEGETGIISVGGEVVLLS